MLIELFSFQNADLIAIQEVSLGQGINNAYWIANPLNLSRQDGEKTPPSDHIGSYDLIDINT